MWSNLKKILTRYKTEALILSTVFIILVIIFSFAFFQLMGSMSLDSNGLPKGFVTYKFVHTQPEGVLYYPNAKVFSLNGSDQHFTETGWAGAWSGAILTTNDSEEQVYAWYDNWLTKHGWQKDQKAIIGTVSTQKSHRSYSKDGKGLATRQTFEIAIDDPKMLRVVIGEKTPTDVTIFEFTYYVKPYSGK